MLNKSTAGSDDLSTNSLWLYKISSNKWYVSCCNYWCHFPHYRISVDQDSSSAMPAPRYAHQFVYDTVQKVHYMFGGNPGRSKTGQMRLDDLWKLSVGDSSSWYCHVMR